jgi:hypothetical protein
MPLIKFLVVVDNIYVFYSPLYLLIEGLKAFLYRDRPSGSSAVLLSVLESIHHFASSDHA